MQIVSVITMKNSLGFRIGSLVYVQNDITPAVYI